MTDVLLRVREDGAEAVGGKFGRLADRVDGVGRAGQRAGRSLKAMLSTDVGGLTGGMGRLYAVLGGVGLAAGAKRILDFNRGLALLKTEAGMTDGEVRRLKDGILSLSRSSGSLPSDILQAYNVFQDFGGQMGLARDIMADLAMLSNATGAPMADLANIAAGLGTNLKMGKGQIVDLLGLIRNLGREGQMSFKDISARLPLLIAGASSAGWKGAGGVKQMVAAHQVAAKSFGTGPDAAARAQVAVDAMIRDLVKKADKIKAGTGINVLEGPAGAKRLRDLPSLMTEIGAFTKGDPRLLSKIFEDEARRGVAAFMGPGGKISPDVARMFGVKGSRADIVEAHRAATTGVGALPHAAAKKQAQMEAALQGGGSDAMSFLAANPLAAGGAALGGYGAIKFLAPWLGKKLLGGGVPGAGGAGGALGGVGMPVRVMNWPPSLGGPSAGMPSGSRELALGGAAKGGAAAATGVVGAALAAGMVGMAVGEGDARQKAAIANKALNDAARVTAGIINAGGGKADAVALAQKAKDETALTVLGPAAGLVAALEKLDRTMSAEPREVKIFTKGGLDKSEVKASRGAVRP